MNSVVIYASRHGNTRQVAEAIADGLRDYGPVQVHDVDDTPVTLPLDTELLVVGGPTEGRNMTEPLVHFFGRLAPDALAGIAAAAFDTRVAWPRVLSGSAAEHIAERLEQAGAKVVVPAESFIVSTKPLLREGELARAPAWARAVATVAAADSVSAEQPVGAR